MGVAQHRARLALVCAVAVLGAACSPPADEPGDDTSNVASETSTGTTDPAATPGEPTVTYAVHEVDPPGPWTVALYGDDMLLVGAETIPDDVVDQIMRIRIAGTRASAPLSQFSLGQFSLENKSYSRRGRSTPPGIAAFTPRASAGLPGRVGPGRRRRDRRDGPWTSGCPLDKDGYLAVASGEQDVPDPRRRVVAQVGTIDTVVNTEWGEELGLVENNALVIYTGTVSPQAFREKLKPIVGDMSMTDLDIVGQYGLDPAPSRSPVRRHLRRGHRGLSATPPIGGGRVAAGGRVGADAHRHRAGAHPRHVTCNNSMMPQLRGGAPGDPDAGSGRRDPPRRVRRLLLPALHRRHDDAVQPLLRAGPRHQRPGQPARHRRRDRPRRRRDLQAVGLRLGRRLELHRPHALRARRDRPRADTVRTTTVTA